MAREINPHVYLLASKRNGTLYLGVTSDLLARIHQHRTGTIEGFSKEHNVKMLVWFEQHGTMEDAIQREKRIKKWRRAWKLDLIEQANPTWRDLADDFGFDPFP
ncbi:GIY-YIG nuclease family protein [Pontixanthobacter aestiaquae]|uniref:GIY-YIG nuclease family protein n=1 Tax=Pontixanthobacter aestiaquae TaxID=1509367 RepID=A0A844Z4S6_9SPHN|nr:GIY-YIG nuclease family protein [Pontixanthobacter aestiaquae]MDN3647205.1 GIY-YIG nuclease family protein [Pontixanthobacter aestiaquae]MXO81820.1 GIY-YIG nuclease family protein [Pontixanthobacter aestiaquae]